MRCVVPNFGNTPHHFKRSFTSATCLCVVRPSSKLPLGSGHHFSVPAIPGDWDNFFADPLWIAGVERVLDHLVGTDDRFCTIHDYANTFLHDSLIELPRVTEGSLNSAKSGGVFQWMGKHINAWENDTSVLGLTWRARNRLLGFQRSSSHTAEKETSDQVAGEMEELWKLLLIAESGDSLGWAPTPTEVTFSMNYAEEVLRRVSALECASGHVASVSILDALQGDLASGNVANSFVSQRGGVSAVLFGAQCSVSRVHLDQDTELIEVRFRATQVSCGVVFGEFRGEVVYCPSGLEWTAVRVAMTDLAPETVYLPLANGLLGLGDELYVIRLNAYGQPAACLDKSSGTVSFKVEGLTSNKLYHWRFAVLHRHLSEALKLANQLNCISPE